LKALDNLLKKLHGPFSMALILIPLFHCTNSVTSTQ
jgi:hypothetical protein